MPFAFLRALSFALIVLVTGTATAQNSVTVTLMDGLNGYAGTTDNFPGSFLPDDNDGVDTTASIGTSGDFGLVRFPIFAREGGPVPNNANIVSATLALYKFGGPDSVFKATRVLKTWNEMQSSWKAASLGVPWQTAGATGAADVLATADGQASIGNATTDGCSVSSNWPAVCWLNINVTSGVQAFASGTLNQGWKVSWVSGSTGAKSFNTRNNTSWPTLRPKLTVTYTLGSAGLPAPQNLDASTSGTTIKLRWSDMSSDETQFKIERKTGQSGTYSQIGTASANATQYTDSTVTVNSTYFYRVRAATSTTNGQYSNEAGITLTAASNDGGGTMDYKYDHFGSLIESKVGTIATTITYDLRGRKIAMSDPDMGNWTYVYDAVGQVKSQTDAKAQASTITYDVLGRIISRTEPDLVSTWTYDACTKGIGKLCQASSDNGFNRTYTYDALGRVSQAATGFDNTIYNVDYTYDSSGRPSTITYPTGFVAKQVYNSFGYQNQLTNSSGTLVYWQANTMSAAGKVLTESFGNGLTGASSYDNVGRQASNVVSSTTGAVQNFSYTWDGVGNLLQRVDAHQGVTESFSYDKFNRLDLSSGPNLVTKSFQYDTLGNITFRSDVGTYTYGAKPHAVSSVSGSVNASYTYDPNGNMTGGNGRTFTYTSFNMPVTVTGNGYTYTYTYSPDHERVRLVHSTLGTFIYLNAGSSLLYEKETRPNGLVEHKHYLAVGASTIGVFLSRSDATQDTRYFHHDHIGSLTLITNPAGAVVERLAYEAFGKRRFTNGTDDPNNTLFGVTTDRGFTMHEHLDEVALIHMNGRVYDPLIARFVTPDPFIQAPFNLQSHNRYSYGFNNPLRGYDPSGYGWFSDLVDDVFDFVEEVVETAIDVVEKVIEVVEENLPTIVAIGLAIATHGALLPMLGPVGAGAAAGFVGGFVGSGGNIEAAIIGGLTGAAFGAIGASSMGSGARVAAHAAVGCVSSAASGGSCASGAIAAGLSKFAQVNGAIPNNFVGGTIASAVVGGTASVLGGGKFANGAVTASFGYVFNFGARLALEGTDAHQAIRNYYRASGLGYDGESRFINGIQVIPSGRLDLFYTGGNAPFPFWEVKHDTIFGIWSGYSDIADYTAAGRGAIMPGGDLPGLAVGGGGQLALAGGIIPGNTYTFSNLGQGLVAYETSRGSGNSNPIPIPVPGYGGRRRDSSPFPAY